MKKRLLALMMILLSLLAFGCDKKENTNEEKVTKTEENSTVEVELEEEKNELDSGTNNSSNENLIVGNVYDASENVIGTISELPGDTVSKYDIEFLYDDVKYGYEFEGVSGISYGYILKGQFMFYNTDKTVCIAIYTSDMTDVFEDYSEDLSDEIINELSNYSNEQLAKNFGWDIENSNVKVTVNGNSIIIDGEESLDEGIARMKTKITFAKNVTMTMYVYVDNTEEYDSDIVENTIKTLAD